MWRTRLSKTWDWIRSRQLVGEDQHHFFYTEFISKGKPERRYVEFKDQNITHSSDRMSIEWWSWLHNRRDYTPSIEEIAMSELQQQTLAERVAVLEAEDERQRLRQFAGSSPGGRAKSTEEEARARRRKKALLRLVDASSPVAQSEEGEPARSFVPPASHGQEGRNLNPEENPTVVSHISTKSGISAFRLESPLTKSSASSRARRRNKYSRPCRGLGRTFSQAPGSQRRPEKGRISEPQHPYSQLPSKCIPTHRPRTRYPASERYDILV